MQLSTELKTNVIIFHDKSKVFITNQQKDLCYSEVASRSGKIIIDGQMYSLSNMAKVLSIEDFYQQYPEERPPERKEFDNEEVIPMTPEQVKNMRKGLMIGLKRYIDEQKAQGKEPKTAKIIYERKLTNFQGQYSKLLS